MQGSMGEACAKVGGAERRAHPRVAVRVPVEIRQAGEVVGGWSEDLSQGGARIAFGPEHQLAVGDRVEMHVRLPGDPDATRVEAEVRWVGEQRKAGVQFRGAGRGKVAAFLAAFLGCMQVAEADTTVPEFNPNADVVLDMEAGGERPDEFTVLQAFEQQYGQLDQCVAESKNGRDKQLPGDVEVEVLLNPEGERPLGVNAKMPNEVSKNKSLRECLRGAVAAASYPSYDGPPVVVQFSFELESGNRVRRGRRLTPVGSRV